MDMDIDKVEPIELGAFVRLLLNVDAPEETLMEILRVYVAYLDGRYPEEEDPLMKKLETQDLTAAFRIINGTYPEDRS
jgi:hypothetical protein